MSALFKLPPDTTSELSCRMLLSKSFRRILLMASLLFLLTEVASAANHYILPAGSGSKSGADWGNACAGLSGSCSASSMTRGDTYYVGGGTYSSGFTFSTATSGTSVITIKGATAADHGTATGWSASYGVDSTQASFPPNAINVYSGYLIFDGNTGSGTTGSSYGFHIRAASPCTDTGDIALGQGGDSVPSLQFSHIFYEGCVGDFGMVAVGGTTTTSINGLTLSYSYGTNWQDFLYLSHNAPYNTLTNVTVDHNIMVGGQSYPDNHGNLVDVTDAITNITVSNNVFNNCAGTVCMGPNDNGTTCAGGWGPGAIYGNVFIVSNTIGNGIIGSTTRCYMHDMNVYNNTFTGVSTYGVVPWVQGCVSGAATCSSATNNIAENNLIWNASCGLASNSGIATNDYDTFLSCIDSPPSEAHGQTGNFNPFVSSSSNNFKLASPVVASCTSTSATCYGLGLASLFSLDPNGILRTGSWDRGAYEYQTSATPPSPTGLVATIE